MYTYSIFWIIEEIAHHYYHKSDLLYRFLVAYHHNDNKEYLSKQFHYITKQFPQNELMSHIQKYCQDNRIQFRIVSNTIELCQWDNFIVLHVDHKKATVYCDSLHSAEQFIFPILRLYNPILFIVNEKQQQYGWISPFLKSVEANKEEVLYSLL